MDKIEQVVREELENILEIDAQKIPKDADISMQPGWDSLCILELLEMIEEKFNVLIPPEKFMDMRTIEDVVNMIRSNS